MSDEYEGMGEFHDLFMDEPWSRLQPVLADAFSGLDPSATLLDLGAGTGLGTRALARGTPARIVAVEPSLTMRAVLTARVADDPDLSRRVTVVAGSLPAALDSVPAPAAGFVCAHLLGHLGAADRRASFRRLATLLAPSGVGVVTTRRPTPPDEPPVEEHRQIGNHTYTARYLSSHDGRTSVTEYEVRDGQRALRLERFIATWEPPSEEQLRAELAEAGLRLEPSDGGTALVRRQVSTSSARR